MKLLTAENKDQWDEFIKSHVESNFLQSWDFTNFILAGGKRLFGGF